MTKKNFKQNNPAMAYINIPETEISEQENLSIVESKGPKEGYKSNPQYIETKSKRMQLLLQPSIAEALKVLAKEKEMSMNETVNEAIKAYLKNEGKI